MTYDELASPGCILAYIAIIFLSVFGVLKSVIVSNGIFKLLSDFVRVDISTIFFLSSNVLKYFKSFE